LRTPKDEGRHGMEYTIRFAFKRDGGIVAPPRRTYSSREAPEKVRDTYRDAVDAALERCTALQHGHAGRCGGPSYRHPLCRRAFACQFDRRTKIGPVKTGAEHTTRTRVKSLTSARPRQALAGLRLFGGCMAEGSTRSI
jgi:hypothetical protein